MEGGRVMENAPILNQQPEALAPRAAPALPEPEVHRVRARRAGLHRASVETRELLGATADGGPAPSALHAAVVRLDVVWADHAAATEAADGILAQVVTDCPRLAPAVARLRRDHATVAAALLAVERLLAPGDEGDAPDAPAARTALGHVLDGVDRHRRAGRLMLHECYQVDLGLGE